jgi:hypothetical protein
MIDEPRQRGGGEPVPVPPAEESAPTQETTEVENNG